LLQSIQVLRGIAAIMVVVTHASASFGVGSAGVDIFFVISGFIMVHTTYYNRGRLRPSLFLKRRIARVVPLYWLCSAVPAAHHEAQIRTILASLFFIPVKNSDGAIQTILQSGWTLNFEMFFYVTFAVCLMLPGKLVYPGILGALSALVVAGIICRPTTAALIYWTNPLLIEFMFGMAIAIAYERGFRMPRPAAMFLIAIGVLTFFVFWWDGYQTPDRVFAGSLTLWWGIPSALIVGGAAFADWRTPSSRLWAAALLLGNASYSIYLVHLIVFGLLRSAGPGIDSLPAFFHVVAAIAVGVLIYLLIEKRIASALRPVLSDKPRDISTPATA
jgi:exopolysaccharide production protein ExoZ